MTRRRRSDHRDRATTLASAGRRAADAEGAWLGVRPEIDAYSRPWIHSATPLGDLRMKEILQRWRAIDGTWLEMRRMRPSDAPKVKESLNRLSPDARRSRFFASIAEFSDDAVRRLVDVDPRNEYLLVVTRRDNGMEIPIAGGRFVQQNDGTDCTFSLLIGDPWQGQGIGRRLLKALMREASRRGLRRMCGQVLAGNRPMLALARSLRFAIVDSEQDAGVVEVQRQLAATAWQRWRAFLQSAWRR